MLQTLLLQGFSDSSNVFQSFQQLNAGLSTLQQQHALPIGLLLLNKHLKKTKKTGGREKRQLLERKEETCISPFAFNTSSSFVNYVQSLYETPDIGPFTGYYHTSNSNMVIRITAATFGNSSLRLYKTVIRLVSKIMRLRLREWLQLLCFHHFC